MEKLVVTNEMIVVDICIMNGVSSIGFFELHSRADQPIISPIPPIKIVGNINHFRHTSASPRWTAEESVNAR